LCNVWGCFLLEDNLCNLKSLSVAMGNCSVDLLAKNHSCKIFIDSHVHIHNCFHLPSFFDAAVVNFLKAVEKSQSIKCQSCFMLLLTESIGKNYFQKLCDLASNNRNLASLNGLSWSFNETSEQGALQACRSDGQDVFLLAGRQIVTEEKLEVLALLTTALFKENRTLIQTVEDVRNSGGIPVLPWGFGKWLGKRGRILKKFIMENDGLVFLGDNSGRPVFWPRPKLFSVIEAKGGKVLPGSDPLPYAWETYKAGSFGCFFQGNFNPRFPSASLKEMLSEPMVSMHHYGQLEKPLKFLRNQSLIQLEKRFQNKGKFL
jgi:hypothetical protein